MEKILVCLSVALAFFACAPAEEAAETAADTDAAVDEVAAVRALTESWDPFANAEDVDGMMGLFTPDAIRLNAGEPALVGAAANRADFAAAFAAMDAVESSSADEVVVAGSWAFARGSYINQTTAEDGSLDEEVGKWVSILRSAPDGWKYAIDAWNRDAPPTTAAAAPPGEPTDRGELPPAVTPSGADEEAIVADGPLWDAANNAEDVDALLAQYTADAIRMNADQPLIQGTEALRANFEAGWQAQTPNGAGVMRGIEVEGDWAYCWGTWTDHPTVKATGEVLEESGKWINVLRRTPDGWKIYIDLWNRDAPPASE